MSETNNKNENSTFDPKAAAEARKAEMEQISKKLEQGVKDVFNGESFKKYLDFCAKLPRYSVNNQLLIMMQKPDATMCQSFTGWKDMNRTVRRGEKGIRILAPAPYKMEKEQDKLDSFGSKVLDKDGEPVKEKVEVTVNAFKPVSTFDISQTEGEPIPQIGVDELVGGVNGYETLLEAIKEAVKVPIAFENIESGAKGFYNIEENRIVVQEGMSEAQTVKTLLHEASHQALHSREAMEHSGEKKSQGQKEVEAESVAYVVCQHYGIDTSDYSFAYVATWSADKEVPELKASLDTIRRTASDLITKIDEKVQEKTQDLTQEQPRYDFAALEDFIKNQEDDIPFDAPVDQPTVVVEPAVDFADAKAKIELKQETEKETAKEDTAKSEADAKKPAKKTEKAKDDKEKPAEKKSVKDKLKAGKEKSEKTKNPKKIPKKNLQEAI